MGLNPLAPFIGAGDFYYFSLCILVLEYVP